MGVRLESDLIQYFSRLLANQLLQRLIGENSVSIEIHTAVGPLLALIDINRDNQEILALLFIPFDGTLYVLDLGVDIAPLGVVIENFLLILLEFQLLEHSAGKQGLGLGFHLSSQGSFGGEVVPRKDDRFDRRLRPFTDDELHDHRIFLFPGFEDSLHRNIDISLFQVEVRYGLGIEIGLDFRHHIPRSYQNVSQYFPLAQTPVSLQHHLFHCWFFLHRELDGHALSSIVSGFGIGFDRFEIVEGIEGFLDLPKNFQTELRADIGPYQGQQLVLGNCIQSDEGEICDRFAHVPLFLSRQG